MGLVKDWLSDVIFKAMADAKVSPENEDEIFDSTVQVATDGLFGSNPDSSTAAEIRSFVFDLAKIYAGKKRESVCTVCDWQGITEDGHCPQCHQPSALLGETTYFMKSQLLGKLYELVRDQLRAIAKMPGGKIAMGIAATALLSKFISDARAAAETAEELLQAEIKSMRP